MFTCGKKVISLILALLCILSIFSVLQVSALDKEDEPVDSSSNEEITTTEYRYEDFSYVVLEDDTIMLTKYRGYNDYINIPDEINEKEISFIHPETFDGYNDIHLCASAGSVAKAYAKENNIDFICEKYEPLEITCFEPVDVRKVKLTWNAVPNAVKYDIYYIRTDTDMDFTYFASTTDISFVDKITDGKTYYYNVIAKDEDGNEITEFYDPGYKYTCISTVPITSVVNTKEGIDIRWSSIEGASYYKVFWRKDGSYTWTALNEKYTDTYAFDTGVSGNTYFYTVRGYREDGTPITYYDTYGTKFTVMHTPYVNNVRNYGSTTPIIWDSVRGASKYVLYYKRTDRDTSWRYLGESKTARYDDWGHVSGKTYEYTVRAVDASGKFYSDYDNDGFEFTYLSTPKVSVSYRNVPGEINISWNKVAGANKYGVYYRRANSSMDWYLLKVTTGTSYIDTGCVNNRTYEYTVQCLNEEETRFTSSYETKRFTYYAMPTVYSVKKVGGDSSGKVCITWTEMSSADYYRVYYKRTDPNGNTTAWKRLAATEWTSYCDTGCRSGYTYTYTIQACDEDCNVIGAWDEVGKSIYYKNSYQGYSYPYVVDSYHVDEDYTHFEIHLSDYDRYYAERILMGEAGNMSWAGMCLVAQSLRDAYVEGGYSSIYDTIKSMGYVAPLYKTPNDEVEECIHFIFDEGGAAAEHRVLVFYASDCCSSGWHESQCFIYQVGYVRFFDMWNW